MRLSFLTTLALASVAFAPAGRAEVTESFERTVALDPSGSFEIENINGPISIRAWDRPEVQISAVKSARTQQALDEISIELEASRNRVSVQAELPSGRARAVRSATRSTFPTRRRSRPRPSTVASSCRAFAGSSARSRSTGRSRS